MISPNSFLLGFRIEKGVAGARIGGIGRGVAGERIGWIGRGLAR